jgi:hypothetical protein
MKTILTTIILVITFHCYSKTESDSTAANSQIKHKHTISGKLLYTSVSRGGIPRDESNLPLIPLKKYTLFVIRFISVDSIPVVVKSFSTNNDGEFSVTLPPGKYGFVTAEEVKDGLKTGQCLPNDIETNVDKIINSSVWESNMPCPLELSTNSIKNLVIINHLISFCVNCQ